MLYFNFNGKLFQENSNITGPDNRGLRYGDGLFETIKYRNGELILIDEHFARLWKGMNQLQFQPSRLFTPDLLEKEITKLVQKNKHTAARVRLSVIRSNGGLYDPKDHIPNYIIQSWPLGDSSTTLNENGLQLCIYRDAKKSMDLFSNLKHNNFLPYFMAALFAKQQQCNDAIILNSVDRICDAGIANIFMFKDAVIYTPSLNEGCIAGVMRGFIINELAKRGTKVIETAISEESLLEADEVFLTNSMFNMRWVRGIGNRTYSCSFTKKIYQQLSETNTHVFC